MANAVTTLTIVHDSAAGAGSLQDAIYESDANNVGLVLDKLRRFFDRLSGGSEHAELTLQLESAGNSTKASGAFTFTAVAVAGQRVRIGGTILTWAASAANENEVTIGANQAASQTNLAAAINAHSALKGLVTAAVSGSTVVVTAVRPGKAGNGIRLAVDGTRATNTVVFSDIPVADETVTINGTALTFKASAAAEDEVTIGADEDETGENLADAVNAHSVLSRLMTAVNAAGTVTLTALYSEMATLGNLMTLAEAATNTTVGAATFANGALAPITCVAALTGAGASTQQAAAKTYVSGGIG